MKKFGAFFVKNVFLRHLGRGHCPLCPLDTPVDVRHTNQIDFATFFATMTDSVLMRTEQF